MRGTPEYAAPESMPTSPEYWALRESTDDGGFPIHPALDVWALGLVGYFVMFGDCKDLWWSMGGGRWVVFVVFVVFVVWWSICGVCGVCGGRWVVFVVFVVCQVCQSGGGWAVGGRWVVWGTEGDKGL